MELDLHQTNLNYHLSFRMLFFSSIILYLYSTQSIANQIYLKKVFLRVDLSALFDHQICSYKAQHSIQSHFYFLSNLINDSNYFIQNQTNIFLIFEKKYRYLGSLLLRCLIIKSKRLLFECRLIKIITLSKRLTSSLKCILSKIKRFMRLIKPILRLLKYLSLLPIRNLWFLNIIFMIIKLIIMLFKSIFL